MQPCSLSFYAGNFSTWEEVATEKHFPYEDISAKVKMTPVEMLIYPKITKLHDSLSSTMAKRKRSHCSTAQLKILFINCLFLPAKMKLMAQVPKINISKKSTPPNCWYDMEKSCNTFYPWREPESTAFHREILCGACGSTHTHTTACSHRVRLKHTDKYCTCAGLHN